MAVPTTGDRFVEQVWQSGLPVFLSPSWLRELYRLVLLTDALAAAGFDRTAAMSERIALIAVLCDLDGFGRAHPYLEEYVRLEETWRRRLEADVEAGRKLAKYLSVLVFIISFFIFVGRN